MHVDDNAHMPMFCRLFLHLVQRRDTTWEHSDASSWKYPLTKSQCSRVVMTHCPWTPMQHGWPMTSQAICSAAWPARPAAAEPSITDLRQIGHLVMSSGHSWGAIDRGASQNLNSIIISFIYLDFNCKIKTFCKTIIDDFHSIVLKHLNFINSRYNSCIV